MANMYLQPSVFSILNWYPSCFSGFSFGLALSTIMLSKFRTHFCIVGGGPKLCKLFGHVFGDRAEPFRDQSLAPNLEILVTPPCYVLYMLSDHI